MHSSPRTSPPSDAQCLTARGTMQRARSTISASPTRTTFACVLPAVRVIAVLRPGLSSLQATRFLVSQQKYLELLEQQEVAPALLVLRGELAPLSTDQEKLHSLSSCVTPSYFLLPRAHLQQLDDVCKRRRPQSTSEVGWRRWHIAAKTAAAAAKYVLRILSSRLVPTPLFSVHTSFSHVASPPSTRSSRAGACSPTSPMFLPHPKRHHHPVRRPRMFAHRLSCAHDAHTRRARGRGVAPPVEPRRPQPRQREQGPERDNLEHRGKMYCSLPTPPFQRPVNACACAFNARLRSRVLLRTARAARSAFAASPSGLHWASCPLLS